jgi:gamma-tubulin complex component 2
MVVLAQLETVLKQGKLTLQKFWYFIQPPMRTLEIVDRILRENSQIRGGKLVNQLYKTWTTLSGYSQAIPTL